MDLGREPVEFSDADVYNKENHIPLASRRSALGGFSMPQMKRGDRTYDKRLLPVEDLARRWKTRGMEFPDEQDAASCLRQIGYYRLSAYAYVFRERVVRIFARGQVFAMW